MKTDVWYNARAAGDSATALGWCQDDFHVSSSAVIHSDADVKYLCYIETAFYKSIKVNLENLYWETLHKLWCMSYWRPHWQLDCWIISQNSFFFCISICRAAGGGADAVLGGIQQEDKQLVVQRRDALNCFFCFKVLIINYINLSFVVCIPCNMDDNPFMWVNFNLI